MKSLIATICILGVVGMIRGTMVLAAETATVAATVTVQNISVSVSDGTVAYGVMPVNTTKSTIPADLNDQQTVTNDGNVNENFNIRGQNTACPWTLANAAGANQYIHRFCNGGGGAGQPCVNPPDSYNPLTTAYQSFATNIAPAGTATLNLQINTPTSSTCFNAQSVDVTILAVAS